MVAAARVWRAAGRGRDVAAMQDRLRLDR